MEEFTPRIEEKKVCYKHFDDIMEIISEENVVFVLEVNADSGIKKGDELEFTTDEKINKKMLVLDKDGKSQMELVGGERIFSRPNTKTLIKFAKKAKSTELDRD